MYVYVRFRLLLLKEFGITNREDQAFNRINLKCTGAADFVQIGFYSTLLATKIYFIGLLMSVLLLFVEFYSFNILKLKLKYI